MSDFPNDFVFGTATSSFQVEGAWDQDGKLPSIWDTFCGKPGAVSDGTDGKTACDQYHRYEEDIDLLVSLGIKAYRFSISWARVVQEDLKTPNMAGIQYYQKLCHYLNQNNISSVATLYHWDMPQILQDRGGWASRETAYAFQTYCGICFKYLGVLVDQWITINEPWCIAKLGYQTGVHAPGISDEGQYFRAIHHVNLAHGLAVECYRELGLTAPVGIALNPQLPRPATRREQDVRAAKTAALLNTDIFLFPLFGSYPDGLEKFGIHFPIEERDMDTISAPIDFIGVNYYNETPVKADPSDPFGYTNAPSWEDRTAMGWPVVPQGLVRVLGYINSYLRPGMKLFITENGAAYDDVPDSEGRIYDRERINYLRCHLDACKKAIKQGIPLSGYYLWSFMDNFEWSCGYTKRFGIVYTDFKTLKRYPKDSAYYYRDVIAGMTE